MSNIFKLNWSDVAGAVTSAVVVAVLGYIATLTDILAIDPGQILSIAILTAITSLAKALTTDSEGKLLGAVKVK